MQKAVGWGGTLAVIIVASLVGCGEGGNEGDCTARISFEAGVYDGDGRLTTPPSDTERIGRGDLVDCDGRPLLKVEVHAIDGVDPEVAIVVPHSADYPGIYVREGVSSDQWPDKILRSK